MSAFLNIYFFGGRRWQSCWKLIFFTLFKTDTNKKVQVFLFMSVFKFRWRRQLGGIIFTFFQFALKLNDNHSLFKKALFKFHTQMCLVWKGGISILYLVGNNWQELEASGCNLLGFFIWKYEGYGFDNTN